MLSLTQAVICILLCLCSRSLTAVEGYRCVSSCQDVPNGDYQSCTGCDVYITCSYNIAYDNRPCPAGLVWDDNVKRCEWTSSTCPGEQTTTSPSTTTTESSEQTTTSPPTTTTESTGPCSGCCKEGEIDVDLTTAYSGTNGTLDGVSVGGISGTWGSDQCSRNILITADFDRITEGGSCDGVGCFTTPPFCGKRMLKVELDLIDTSDPDTARSGRLVNVGDSSTNNGYAGDAVTQQNDAEADGQYPNIRVHGSDKCSPQVLGLAANVLQTANRVALFIGNEYLRVLGDDGTDVQICHKCLYALNGQSDSNWGGINERIFIGINRVVSSDAYRRGKGVCQARISWACDFS